VKKIYRNCDELPVYNFYKIVETMDYSYLYVDFDGYTKVDVSNDVELVWEAIYEEYLKLTENNTAILYYEVVKELLYLQTRYEVASSLLQQLAMGKMDENMFKAYVLELRKWQYDLDEKKPLKEETERLVAQLRASQNKIRLKEEEKKSFENKETGDNLTLVQQQVKLEQALSRNEIDTKKNSSIKMDNSYKRSTSY
jgi:hypothetical protein